MWSQQLEDSGRSINLPFGDEVGPGATAICLTRRTVTEETDVPHREAF